MSPQGKVDGIGVLEGSALLWLNFEDTAIWCLEAESGYLYIQVGHGNLDSDFFFFKFHFLKKINLG